MKIKTILFIYCCLHFFSLLSQNKVEKELEFYKALKNKVDVYKGSINFLKATNFFYEKEWDSTLLYSLRCLSEKNIENIYEDYSHFYRGKAFHNKGLFIEAVNEFEEISLNFDFYNVVKLHLGELELELKHFKKAITYFNEIIDVTKGDFYFIKKGAIIHNLGLCYLHLKQFDKAEEYLYKSVKFQETEKDTVELVGAYGDLANLYYEQYKDDLAIPYFEKAYQFSKSINNVLLKRNTALNMSVVEENRKNFEKALKYRKESECWKDSLNDQNKIYEVAKRERVFAVQQKQKEVDLLKVRNELQKTQRNIFLYSAVGLLILLGGSLYFYREKVKNNRIITQQKETLDELNATKDKLFSIVSHDLRSSVNALKTSNITLQENLENKRLENLKSLLQNNSAIVNGAYSLLDNLLNWALLQTEKGYFKIAPLRLFFIVEQVAFNYKAILSGKKIAFNINVSKKEIVLADQESLKIILRNFIDNAIKFSEEGGRISIYVEEMNPDYCDLIIEDTGLGMSEETRLKLLEDTVLLHKKEHEDVIGTGLGLQLCKSMIKKNNGKFYIESELGKGTKMIVSLPRDLG